LWYFGYRSFDTTFCTTDSRKLAWSSAIDYWKSYAVYVHWTIKKQQDTGRKEQRRRKMKPKYTGKRNRKWRTRRKEAQANLSASANTPSKVLRVILRRRITDVRWRKGLMRAKRGHNKWQSAKSYGPT
jgi:hypothetical protein